MAEDIFGVKFDYGEFEQYGDEEEMEEDYEEDLEVKYTHAILWFPPSFLAVKHHNIKNWVPSILTHNLWLVFMGMKQKQIYFLKKI